MRKLLLWWIIFCVVVFLAVGWATDFSTIDIQLHDTYFVIPPAHLFLVIGILGAMFMGLDWLSRNNKALTLAVFLLNGLLCVGFATAAVFTWRQSFQTSRMYPSYFEDSSMKVMTASLLIVIMVAGLQMALAMRALWRFRRFRA